MGHGCPSLHGGKVGQTTWALTTPIPTRNRPNKIKNRRFMALNLHHVAYVCDEDEELALFVPNKTGWLSEHILFVIMDG
jgi:hypothetical protein